MKINRARSSQDEEFRFLALSITIQVSFVGIRLYECHAWTPGSVSKNVL